MADKLITNPNTKINIGVGGDKIKNHVNLKVLIFYVTTTLFDLV